ncbi:MAG: pyruvate ferredoxin oxidoreductase [Prevotella sp.]|nr:pyruvate ferredoxin oxidoreductase [Prevotella sp.]
MDYKYIEQLLERYFEGTTTLDEEQALRTFFAQEHDDMPEELEQWAPLFAVVNERPALDEDFDKRVLAMTVEAAPVKARTISLAQRLRPLFGAAAVVAILLTLSQAINQSLRSNDIWVDADRYAKVKQVTDEAAVAYDQLGDSLKLAKDEMAPVTPADSMMSGKVK